MQRRIAVNSNSYHGFTLEQAIEGTSQAGFEYMELTATKGWTEHVFPGQSFERLLQIKRLLLQKRITPIGMSGHCNLLDTARALDFENNIHLAAFFGCEYIVTSIGEAHLEDQAKGTDEEAAQRIRAFLPLLHTHGLTLVLETHGHAHGTGQAVGRIVKLVGDARVKINYDTANVIFYGDVDPVHDLMNCAKDVGYVHLKEKAGGRQEWNFPALGKGYVDFPAIFRVLDERENKSPLSIEIEFTKEGAKDVAQVHQAVMDSALYLRGLGVLK